MAFSKKKWSEILHVENKVQSYDETKERTEENRLFEKSVN